MGDIYLINFIREDRARISRVKAAIEALGWEVDWDGQAPNRHDWPDVFLPRVAQARCALVLWSTAAADNRWTSVQADVAQEQRRLVSATLEPVTLPRAFRQTESVDLGAWTGDPDAPELELLVARLAAILGPPPRGRPPAVAASAGEPVDAPLELPSSAFEERTAPRPGGVTGAAPVILMHPASTAPPASTASPGLERRPRRVGDRVPGIPVYHQDDPPGVALLASELADDSDLGAEFGFIPVIYGWALAWTLGLTAMGVYVRTGLDLGSASAIYLSNSLYSAVIGSAVGLVGAAFMVYALHRQRVWMSPSQMGFILLGWSFGGGVGLVATTGFGLPVMGVAYGIVGFEIGWVLCWIIGGAVGGAFTWIALRRSNPELGLTDLSLVTAGFGAGSVIGWIGGWILLSMPVMLFTWLIGKLITEGGAPLVGEVMTELTSLGLIGAGGGAAFGLAGGLLLFGVLTRAGRR